MASLDEDYSWSPPSEAELKVIEARRERNNKISSLMGQYLLKGYKMLAITCPMCDCVLLEDRAKAKYCIGCCEVDADTKKDNPATNEEAARKAVEEIQHRQRQDKECSPLPKPDNIQQDRMPKPIISNISSKQSPLNGHLEPSLFIATSTTEVQPSSSASSLIKSLNFHGVDMTKDVGCVMESLRAKLGWAGEQLQVTTSVHEARNLAELISEICKAISALKEL